jgi:hypothetical protein
MQIGNSDKVVCSYVLLVVTNVSKSLMPCELLVPKELVSLKVPDRCRDAVLGSNQTPE